MKRSIICTLVILLFSLVSYSQVGVFKKVISDSVFSLDYRFRSLPNYSLLNATTNIISPTTGTYDLTTPPGTTTQRPTVPTGKYILRYNTDSAALEIGNPSQVWKTLSMSSVQTFDTTAISNFGLKVRSLFSASAPLQYNAVTGNLTIPQATSSTSGYLSQADWVVFNSRLPDPGSNGLVARTAAGITQSRQLVAGSTNVTLNNANGVSGNPVIDINDTLILTQLQLPYIPAALSTADSALFLNRTTGLLEVRPVPNGTSGSINNGNIGSGLRWLDSTTQKVKTVFPSNTIGWDSTSNTNGLTAKVDTSVIATQYDLTLLTAANGITRNVNTFELGGTLNQNTTINTTSAYSLNINGNNTGITTGNLYLYNNGTTGTALFAETNGGYAGRFHAITGGSASTAIPVLSIGRGGGSISNGIGTILEFKNQTTINGFNSANTISNQLISKWTDATDATRTSQFEIWGVNSTTLARKMSISGAGQITMDGYTGSNFQTTDSSFNSLVIDGSGNVYKRAGDNGSGGGSGSVTQVNTGFGLLGGPITTTGTALADSTVLEIVNRKTQTLATPNPYADAVRYPSAAATIFAGTFNEYPHLYCSGSGTLASPYINADSTAYLQTILDTFKVARLTTKRYKLDRSITIRNTPGGIKTAAIVGVAGFIMYPNAEGQVVEGSILQTDTTAIKIGTLDFVNQPRPGRVTIKDLTIWGAGRTLINGVGGNWDGAGILVDGSTDQPQFMFLNISNTTYAIVVSGICDAGTISNSSLIGNRYSIWIDTTARAATYTSIRGNIIADNQGPIVIDGGIADTSSWVEITNNKIASNGYVNLGDLGGAIPNCNLYLNSSGNIVTNNYITNAGYSNLNATRITADGIVVEGDDNTITNNIITGQNQPGSCGIRVKSGSNRNVINCTFRLPLTSYFPLNETDVIIEAGATNTTLYVYPGMTYTDNGTGTVIIPTTSIALPLNEVALGTGPGITSSPKYKFDGTNLLIGNGTTSQRIVYNYNAGNGGAFVFQLSGVDQLEWGGNNNGAFGGTGRTLYGYDVVRGGYIFGANSLGEFYTGNSNTAYSIKLSQPAAGNIPITIKGASSQTANLTQWLDNGDASLSFIDANGVFNRSINTNTNVFGVKVTNGSNGTSAESSLGLTNDAGTVNNISISSSGYTNNAFIGANAAFQYSDGSGGLAILLNNAASTFRVATGGTTERFRIAANGNVTIGTLDTDGSAPTTAGTTRSVICDENGLLSFTTAGNTIYAGDGTLAGNRIVTGSNNDLTFTGIDQFKIATTYLGHSKTDGSRVYSSAIGINSSQYWQFGYSGSVVGSFPLGIGMVIDTLNNIGLGDSPEPSSPLYSNGSSTTIAWGLQSENANYFKVNNITTNTTLNNLNYNFLTVDATSGNVTITLPAASASFGNSMGLDLIFKRLDSSGNTVTIQRAGSDTIDGTTSFSLTTQYESKAVRAISTTVWAIH